MNRGETWIELTAALSASLFNEEEDEAADHNRGGERADDEDCGENGGELIEILLVLRPFLCIAEVAILVAGLRARSFAFGGSFRCRPLGGCRRRCCRCRRRCCRRC